MPPSTIRTQRQVAPMSMAWPIITGTTIMPSPKKRVSATAEAAMFFLMCAESHIHPAVVVRAPARPTTR